ncbi:hypothetical protein C8R45DRAFT_921610 [Mycena sanguinolenta]|nr:hypothetical protein C8R45DRAFT_921610 [Mycena sanguinolenta]
MNSENDGPLTGTQTTAVKSESIDVDLISWDNTTAPFTPRTDKAFKREAMHLDGAMPHTPLRNWLDNYRPPTTPICGPEYYRKKRAEHVACEAARKTAKTFKKHAGNAPKACGYPKISHNAVVGPQANAKERREAQECRAQEHAKASQLLGTNAVAITTALWESMARSFPVFPDFMWLEVSLYLPLTQILVLLQLSPAVYRSLLHLVYRRIQVTRSAPLLVAALAANEILPPLVSSLCMEDPTVHVDPDLWAAIVPRLENLKTLVVAPSAIPMSLTAIPLIRFRLTTFYAITTIQGPWIDFIAACPSIVFLVLHDSFDGRIPSRRSLPSLRAIKARPDIIAKFAAEHARLTEAWFFTARPLAVASGHLLSQDLKRFSVSSSRLDTIRICTGDLLLLIAAAPEFVSSLQCIVLDEDLTWSDFLLKDGPSLSKSALRDLALALDLRQIGTAAVGPYFDAKMPSVLRTSCGATVRPPNSARSIFFAVDGYVEVLRWGSLNETTEYINIAEEWDEVYSRPAVIFGVEDYTYLFPSPSKSTTDASSKDRPRFSSAVKPGQRKFQASGLSLSFYTMCTGTATRISELEAKSSGENHHMLDLDEDRPSHQASTSFIIMPPPPPMPSDFKAIEKRKERRRSLVTSPLTAPRAPADAAPDTSRKPLFVAPKIKLFPQDNAETEHGAALEEWLKGAAEEYKTAEFDPTVDKTVDLDPAAEKQEWEVERERAWKWAVKVCLAEMPELDRQECIREQRRQEQLESQRLAWQTYTCNTVNAGPSSTPWFLPIWAAPTYLPQLA